MKHVFKPQIQQSTEHIRNQVAAETRGKSTVQELSAYMQQRQPGIKGFSASDIWRMLQFFECHQDQPKLAPMVRELNRTNNLIILGKT